MYDVAVIGAGIVGLATARACLLRIPSLRLLVLEKEEHVACHQTGRNSGVIHSGIYYRPGSLKASLAVAGNRAMVRFCRERGVPHSVCGKVILATRAPELAALEELARRMAANGVPGRRLVREELAALEPHAARGEAIYVESTGVTDFRAVAAALAEDVRGRGGHIALGEALRAARHGSASVDLATDSRTYRARLVITCAGLQGDRVARMMGAKTRVRILPFRGEYFRLEEPSASLVKGLLYPVPNPAFPFLGVHFTRMLDGSVHCGPNAVLALSREGYRRLLVRPRDASEILASPAFWRLAGRYWRHGLAEVARSLSRRLFARSLRALVPDVRPSDLRPEPAGVRAQAVLPDGTLVDDFLIERSERCVHVLNAPSPAATASLAIGAHVAELVLGEGA